MAQKLSTLANEIWPLLLPRIQKMVQDAGAGGGGAAQLAAHDLSGSLHRGTLADSQAPQFLMRNGSRSLAGNLAVDTGVTIDGVDLDAHAANPDAHHARAHAYDSADHTGTLSWVKVNKAGASLADLPTRLYADLQTRTHSIIGGDHSVTGSAWQIVGVLSANTLGLMTPNANPGATEAILKTDVAGMLALAKLRTPLIDTASGDMSITPAGDLTLNPAGGEIFIPGVDTLRSTAWTAGLLGVGWGIQERAGQAGKSHLDIRSIYTDELIATTFTADQVRVRSGSDWLGESMAIAARDNSDAKVTIPNVGGGAVRIYVENAPEITGQIFDANEFVLIKTINRSSGLVIRETWGQVSSYIAESGNRQSYSWTTVSGGGNFTLEPGTALIGFGVTAGSFIFRSVVEAGRGPFERFATWTGNPYTPANRTSRVEIGDLRNAIGDATTRYGIAAGNNLALTPATGFAGFSVDSVYGARLYSTAIALYNGGTQTVNISNTGTDIWVGPSSADKRLAWNGTTLTLVGNLKVQQDANNYVEINQSLNKLRGVGAGTEQWYASAADGSLYFGAGTGLLNAVGMLLYRRADASSPSIGFMVGSSITGGVFYYPSGGYDTVRISTSTDPGRIVLAAYNPGDANNPPASITIQQNAYVPLVDIKGVVSINTAKLTSNSVFSLRNVADSAYQSLNLLNLGLLGGKILSDSELQIRNTADNANQGMRAKYLYSVDSVWYSAAMHQFRDASSGSYNTMRSKAHYIESSTDPGAGTSAIALWWDGTNLRATLPGGTTKTFTWT